MTAKNRVTCNGLSPVDGEEYRREHKVLHVNGHVPRDVDAIVACFPRDVLPKVVEVDQVEPPAWANLLDISENIIDGSYHSDT